MTIRLTVSMMLSAPGGATVEGREIDGPTGRACGPATGGATCCRSRPGCAPGGIACAAALTGMISSNRPTHSRLTPGAMPASSPTRTPFHRDGLRLAWAAADWNASQALASLSEIADVLEQ